ncbi:hypothetical protein [Pseudovibrio sp. Tun.PSC04-5.I4]|uniref:hypothetical protein n=1 Tax=Pseudovibrio sp. Tun.PSC04-5.I4 TaxID=1798213 RepID=UPI000B846E31|nr:hypothetical protein [Pseudovibrio sp. Tun.PSC04-5.I4]
MPLQTKVKAEKVGNFQPALLGRIHPALTACYIGCVTRGLPGTKVAAIAEDRENIALFRVGRFWTRARWRSKMTGVAGLARGIFKNIEQMPFTHTAVNLFFKGTQPFRLRFTKCLFGMGLPGGGKRQIALSRKPASTSSAA